MSSKVAIEQTTLDTVKLGAALLVLTGAVVAFYYYADASKLIRVVGLVAAVGVAAAVALQTEKGRTLSGFIRESQVEVRKVVWPTRQETVQTTFVVIIVVIIIALFLWFLDWGLGAIVHWVMGRNG
jgi:preprotein translocase subunit SecE